MYSQPGILAPLAASSNYVTLSLVNAAAARDVVARLSELRVDDTLIVGIGEPLVRALGRPVEGLHTFPALSGLGPAVPSTQGAVFLQTRTTDHGGALTAMVHVIDAIGAGVRIDEDVPASKHDIGRDLSGFEDGTENPQGDDAIAAAITADGSSFVAVQRWIHDLRALAALDGPLRDQVIGRSMETNEELEDAPAHAHVKRTAQESFDPPAFMVRRSMPYGTVREHGLYFVAFIAELERFDRMLRRMCGLDDGIVDGLFSFSRPVSGGYYWCPPVIGTQLDLRRLG
ncbi:MAG TPA: Dyp-type peroxidase [Kofleriaceae bacterium]|nr:Dyp-type peroxidase [Kofleriaceae bacterium]